MKRRRAPAFIYRAGRGDDRDVLARDRKLIFQINSGRAINTTREPRRGTWADLTRLHFY